MNPIHITQGIANTKSVEEFIVGGGHMNFKNVDPLWGLKHLNTPAEKFAAMWHQPT